MGRKPGGRRGVSAGTIAGVLLAFAVLIAAGLLLKRMAGPGALDTSRLLEALHVSEDLPPMATDDIPIENKSLLQLVETPGAAQTPSPQPANLVMLTPAPTAVPRKGGSFSLTAGGTVAMEKAVRQAGYYKEAGRHDFTEIFSLVKERITGDITLVTLENLIDPDAVSFGLNAPEAVAPMLASGGINTVALGFGRVFENGWEGLSRTAAALEKHGLGTVGVSLQEEESGALQAIREYGGVKVALLHCVDTLTSKSKSALKKDGRSWIVPTTETIAQRVREARLAGAEVVIVSVHWGTEGKTAPTKAQTALAQQIADAGADVILGSGTRRVQRVDQLQRADGGTTLCFYSLGCLLSEDRAEGAVAGLLLHLDIRWSPEGGTEIEASCTPTYLWQYKQDGASYYRVVNAAAPAPDGMSSADSKSMEKALRRVRDALPDLPLRD